MTVPVLFFLIAVIISLGYVGAWLFRVTRIPEAMLLIVAGFALQSVLGVETAIFVAIAFGVRHIEKTSPVAAAEKESAKKK